MNPTTATVTKFGNLAWSATQLISEASVVTPFVVVVVVVVVVVAISIWHKFPVI